MGGLWSVADHWGLGVAVCGLVCGVVVLYVVLIIYSVANDTCDRSYEPLCDARRRWGTDPTTDWVTDLERANDAFLITTLSVETGG